MEVMYKLWQQSWRRDAVKLDRASGTYTDPSLVREINHKGKYFTVPGPHICAPSPQRTPVIMQAGTSSAGKAFAAKHAETIFVSGHSAASIAKSVREIREGAVRENRDPKNIKFLAKCCPVIGRTVEEAEAKYAEYASYGDREGALALFGGWTGVGKYIYHVLLCVLFAVLRSCLRRCIGRAEHAGISTSTRPEWQLIIGVLIKTR